MNVDFQSICLSKEKALKDSLKSMGSIAIAYSGGVDSTYLAEIANEVLQNNARIIIADSPSIPRSELQNAIELAENKAWNLTVIKTAEYLDQNYRENTGDRCYYCKNELFKEMDIWCRDHGIVSIAYGAIIDDFGDHRPGAKAAEEYKVLAPLQDAELSKDEIRYLSKLRNLSTSSKASFACLASRLPVGEEVTVEKLSQIEMAEEIIKTLDCKQYRARHHGDICRIEVGEEELIQIISSGKREWLVKEIKKLGYKFVTLDLSGYRTGSTNGLEK